MTAIDLLAPLRRRRSRSERIAEQFKALESSQGVLRRAIADHYAYLPDLERGKTDILEKTALTLAAQFRDCELRAKNLDHQIQTAKFGKVNPLARRSQQAEGIIQCELFKVGKS